MQVNDIDKVDPTPARLNSITVTFSLDEVLYVLAELGCGNSYSHPGTPTGVYDGLIDALQIGCGQGDPFKLKERLHKQEVVSRALRPIYDIEGAKRARKEQGI